MDFSTTPRPYGALVTVETRLDILSSKELQGVVEAAFAAGARNLVMDLSGAEYISSSGLRVLLSARKLARAASGTVHLAAPVPFVMDVLVTTGFDKLFAIHATVEAAEAALEG
jgi:anti-sigma B factor antagonist